MKTVEAVFQKTKIFNFFLIFILREDRKKKKKETGNICSGTPDIEFEEDWLVILDAILDNG